ITWNLPSVRRSRPSPGISMHATAPTEMHTLSLHDALPISWNRLFDETMASLKFQVDGEELGLEGTLHLLSDRDEKRREAAFHARSEEHTSELQSQSNLVCRLLLEKKKTPRTTTRANSRNRP